MTIETEDAHAGTEMILGKTRAVYEELSRTLVRITGELSEMDGKDARGALDLLRQHWKSALATLELENDLEKRRRERAGIVHGYAIDLAAAQSEIGSRIARLRDAGRVGAISDGAD